MVNILIIDDQLSGLLTLEDVLRPLPDTRIIKCSSAKSALKLMMEQNVDCILLDVSMPEMDGFEFLQTLQTAPAHTDIPVIMVTGKIFSENETLRAYQYGAVDFLFKPIDAHVVYRKVGFFVNQARRMKRLEQIEKSLNNLNQQVISPLEQLSSTLTETQQADMQKVQAHLDALWETWERHRLTDHKIKF